MISVIYVEQSVQSHPRTLDVLARYPNVPVISCEHYGEVFNRAAQNFRLQKTLPALILARKDNRRVLPAPPGYGIGDGQHYYFSHMLNCVYDCRYCFLQGMYRSASYILFINFEDFAQDIESTVQDAQGETVYFYSGYDCDSLAFEPVSKFVETILPVFERLPGSVLELRTKSTQVRQLLSRPPAQNVVVAFSLSPENIVKALEHKTPSLDKRLAALAKLQQHGWRIGLRFDPIIWHQNWETVYQAFFEQVFAVLDGSRIHSVSLGAFRLPENFFNNIVKLYPREALFAMAYEKNNGMVSYAADREALLMAHCEQAILKHIRSDQYFPCFEKADNE